MFFSLQDYPSLAQLHEKLQQSNILPIFAVTKSQTDLYKVVIQSFFLAITLTTTTLFDLEVIKIIK